MRATRAITNHAPIGEYHLHFFLKEDFSCLYGFYMIESRCHILHECRRFNNYWNPMSDTISQFVSFLECFLLWRRHHIAEQSPCSFSSFWSYFLFSFLFSLLWQSLDQCPIASQVVNLKGGYLVGNTSCVFTRELKGTTTVSQTSFSLYLHNQWTDFHKLSCAGKPQMRAIRTYVGCTKATTND